MGQWNSTTNPLFHDILWVPKGLLFSSNETEWQLHFSIYS